MTGTNTLLDTGTVPIPVADGGQGNASLTAFAVLCGGTTSTAAVQAVASVGTTGQVLTSNGAGALPTFQAGGGGGGGLTWNNQASGTATLAVSNAYWTNNGASLVTYTLPSTAAQFSIIQVLGNSSGGWKIAQLSGQSIVAGNLTTTVGTGGSVQSTTPTDGVTLLCIVANTTFQVYAGSGNYSTT
jgi:hypothetical protein